MNTPIRPNIIISTYDDLDNPYYAGGGARAVHEVARRLVDDYNVTVLTGDFPGATEEMARDGVRYIRIGSSSIGSKLGQLVFTALLPYYAKRMNYDLWIESFTPPFSISALPLVSDKPVIGLVHMLSAQDMERKYKLPFRYIENAGLKWYRSFITLSPGVQKKIHAINPNAIIERIPNGVNLPVPSPSTKPCNYFLFMGRIEVDQKGLDLLLGAYALVKDKINHPLLIVGDGHKKDILKLKTTINDLKLTKQVKLIGRVGGVEKDRLFRESLAVVCSSRFETYPLTALEAMSYKKCLISFNIEGVGWIPRDSQIKVPCFNTHDLAKRLLSVSKRPATAAHIGTRAFEFVKHHSWDSTAAKYRSFIMETLRGAQTTSSIWQFNTRKST